MSDTPRTDAASYKDEQMCEVVDAKVARQLERELNDLRTDAARYRAVRGLCVGQKWSDTSFFYSAACPPDEKYVNPANFDQMADRLCEGP